MELQLRSWYSKQGFSHALNIHRFPEDYKHRDDLKTTALRFLFQFRHKERALTVNDLVAKALELFDYFIRERKIPLAREVTDIIIEFAPNHRRKILDRLRDLENDQEEGEGEVEEEIRREILGKPIKKVVYADSQNVHNTQVNQSVLQASRTLYNMFRHVLELKMDPRISREANDSRRGKYKDECLDQIGEEFQRRYPNKQELIKDSFGYVKRNVGTFGIDTSLQDVLLALWLWIQEHQHRHELELRLLEELREMHGQCSTGHLARLVNVMQGFTENEHLAVRISDKEQYNAVIRNYLNTTLSKCDDEDVINGMVDGSEKFKRYVKTKIKDILLTWIDDYGKEILEYIPGIVNDYVKAEIFTK
uniref:Uncharacterized protein n=1 Tax=viral metagenome TaxID=1070528 RepID=A0A6C0ELW6_9ZZZZ